MKKKTVKVIKDRKPLIAYRGIEVEINQLKSEV